VPVVGVIARPAHAVHVADLADHAVPMIGSIVPPLGIHS